MTSLSLAIRVSSRFVVVAGLSLACFHGAAAQTPNADILQRLAVECLLPAATPFGSVALQSDLQYPFLDQAITRALRDGGAEVFLDAGPAADSASGRPAAPTLTYFVVGSSIRYEGKGGRVKRFVALDLGYLIQDAEGKVTSDSTCRKQYADEVPRSQLDAIESSAMPITQGVRPRRNWIRRYAEPVVVGAATAVAVYLFFNVRSDANDSP